MDVEKRDAILRGRCQPGNATSAHRPYHGGVATQVEEKRTQAPTHACPLRIFHGPENVAGVAATLARAQRLLGHHARAGVFGHEFGYATGDAIALSRRRPARALRAAQIASSFDVFQLYFGQGLLGPRLTDVPLLRKLGKKVFFYFCGCDIRDEKATIMRYPISGCRDCFPKLCAPNRDRARWVAETYADANFVVSPDLLEFVDRSVLMLAPYDADRVEQVLREPVPERETNRFVVVHAPSNHAIKGSKYLVAAVEGLRREGVPIDLEILSGMSHLDVLRKARTADLAVDQLLVGSYGLFAAEMMALGVPVAVFLRDDLVGEYPAPPPVHQATPETIAGLLRAAVEGALPLRERAAEGVEYARAFHAPERVARQCLEFYA